MLHLHLQELFRKLQFAKIMEMVLSKVRSLICKVNLFSKNALIFLIKLFEKIITAQVILATLDEQPMLEIR
jgi:hypothetical protein